MIEFQSQRDSRWCNLELGWNTSPDYTIGWVGCTLTCVAMAGHTTPDVLNEALKAQNGFVDGGLMVFSAILSALRMIPDANLLTTTHITPVEYKYVAFPDGELGVLFDALGRGAFVLCEVNFNPGHPFAMHWVLAYGMLPLVGQPAQILIADPWPLEPEERAINLCPRYGPNDAYALVRAVVLESAQ